MLKAALTDGPDSPICGKVRARTYPVEERAGLVWVYDGRARRPARRGRHPRSVPAPDAVIVGRHRRRQGNWRYAAENGFDEAHARYLHRYGSLWTMFKQFPAWACRR